MGSKSKGILLDIRPKYQLRYLFTSYSTTQGEMGKGEEDCVLTEDLSSDTLSHGAQQMYKLVFLILAPNLQGSSISLLMQKLGKPSLGDAEPAVKLLMKFLFFFHDTTLPLQEEKKQQSRKFELYSEKQKDPMDHRLSNGLEIRITEFHLFPTPPRNLTLSLQAGCSKGCMKNGAQ